MNKTTLSGLESIEYEHPFDRVALDRLENTRGLDLFTRKVLEMGLEKYLWFRHTGDNVMVTEQSIPELYHLLTEACGILEMSEVPEFHLFLDDKIKSFSSGEKRRMIALSSGALELLEPEELLFMIGRELGHIRSNHVLYRMMADSLQMITRLASDLSMGLSNWLSLPLQTALLHWYRMSEFTADRAGLLTCQNEEVAISTFIKMAGLPRKYHGRITTADFREQAKNFEGDKDPGQGEKLIRFAAVYENNQPFTLLRVSQLDQWTKSGAYERILDREHVDFHLLCSNPACRQPLDPEDQFCAACGTPAMDAPPSDSVEIVKRDTDGME